MFSWSKLDLAIASGAKDCPIWAEDLAQGEGKKRYFAVPYDVFYRCTKDIPADRRHFYEVLMPDRPTHLYLDVEYAIMANPTLGDVSPGIDATVRDGFDKLLGITDLDLVELDASGPTKYSRHMIYRVRDGRMFKNPYHCGAFLRRLTFPGVVEVVDRTVYTKRRLFRCAGSTKLSDPTRPLLPRGNVLFMDTLVQSNPLPLPLPLLECFERDGSEPVSGMGPIAQPKPKPEEDLSLPKNLCLALAAEIGAFWKDGVVTFANHDREAHTLFFTSDSRWCGLKGSEHSSNHVYFVADLNRGAWRQGCHNRTRGTCCRVDAKGKIRPRWGDWKLFAHSEEVRTFIHAREELETEYRDILMSIDQTLDGT